MRLSTSLPVLKKRSDFLHAAQGRKAARPGLVLHCVRQKEADETGCPRIGFTVTKKVGNAPTRSRIKRRLREVAKEVLPRAGKPGFDYVLIGRRASLTRSFADLLDDLEKALQMISNQGRQNRSNRGQN